MSANRLAPRLVDGEDGGGGELEELRHRQARGRDALLARLARAQVLVAVAVDDAADDVGLARVQVRQLVGRVCRRMQVREQEV